MDTGRFKCSPWEEWIWLFELSQRLQTPPGAFLSTAWEFWIKRWGWCSLVPRADSVPVRRGSWARPHPTRCWPSGVFCHFCIHPPYCGSVPQALRQRALWEHTVSSYQLWNILGCLWVPEPIQSSTVPQAHGKDKTAPHSKWIPHCAGNRRVPHCPAAPSRFLFFYYAKSHGNELDACTERFNGTSHNKTETQ